MYTSESMTSREYMLIFLLVVVGVMTADSVSHLAGYLYDKIDDKTDKRSSR